MTRWRTSALAALLAAGISPAAWAATATVYYSTAYKGWSTVDIHHNASGTWTTAPGTVMSAACNGWTVATLNFSTASFQAVFNNGAGAWDNPTAGGNYTVAEGVHQVKNGAIVANAGNPCGTTTDNTATVFYKPASTWTTVNLHYALNGGAWTTAPGVAMDAACTGWRKKTVSLGVATGLAATFNNGATWDNNNGANYALGTGTQAVGAGAISTTDPCGGDTTAPSVPTGLATTATTSSSVSLSWAAATDNTGVAGYDVYRNGTLAGSSTGTSYTATGLAAQTAYSFTVRARDAAGNASAQSAALSATTSGTTADTTAPSVPTGLTATTSGTTIALGWAASTDDVGVSGYTVTRTGGAGTVTTTVGRAGFTDTGAAQTTYSYTVSASDAAGNRSAASAPVGATTGTAASGTPIGTDMREDAIYFVMTARFYDGDSTNNRGGQFHTSSGNAASNDPMYRGDFKGLMQKLDYIKALGFSAVWITPVVLNRSDYDFHGYHGWDFMNPPASE